MALGGANHANREEAFQESHSELSLERERENIPFEVQKVVDNEDDRFTIEHVWPQTVSDEFPEHLHETINENSDRLGNLALMTIEDNAGNQNDPHAF